MYLWRLRTRRFRICDAITRPYFLFAIDGCFPLHPLGFSISPTGPALSAYFKMVPTLSSLMSSSLECSFPTRAPLLLPKESET